MSVNTAYANAVDTLYHMRNQAEKFLHLEDYRFLLRTIDTVMQRVPFVTSENFITDKRSALMFLNNYVEPVLKEIEAIPNTNVTGRAKQDIRIVLTTYRDDILRSF